MPGDVSAGGGFLLHAEGSSLQGHFRMQEGVSRSLELFQVKQCQSNRDGKGPSRFCPRALVASQPAVRRLLDDGGETTPPTPFLVTYLMGRADGPGIPGCWTLRSGSSSHLGLLHTELGQFVALVTAQSGHGHGQSKVWGRAQLVQTECSHHFCLSRTSSRSFCPLPTLVCGRRAAW